MVSPTKGINDFANSQSNAFDNGQAVDVIARRRAPLELSQTFVDAVKSKINGAQSHRDYVCLCCKYGY